MANTAIKLMYTT